MRDTKGIQKNTHTQMEYMHTYTHCDTHIHTYTHKIQYIHTYTHSDTNTHAYTHHNTYASNPATALGNICMKPAEKNTPAASAFPRER